MESDLAQNISDKIITLKNDSMTRRYYVMTSLKIADLQRDAYTEGREEGISLGREEGISIGLERGAYEKALETARNLLQDGFTPEMISKYTTLSIDAIEGLAKT